MRYDIYLPGDGFVYINRTNKVKLETFIQTLKDVDKNNRMKFYGSKNGINKKELEM